MELIIAVAILSMGSLAAVRATDQARHVIGGDATRVLARLVAENRAEELRIVPPLPAPPAQVEMGGHLFTIDVREETTAAGLIEATLTVRSDAGPGARLVVYLPGSGP